MKTVQYYVRCNFSHNLIGVCLQKTTANCPRLHRDSLKKIIQIAKMNITELFFLHI